MLGIKLRIKQEENKNSKNINQRKKLIVKNIFQNIPLIFIFMHPKTFNGSISFNIKFYLLLTKKTNQSVGTFFNSRHKNKYCFTDRIIKLIFLLWHVSGRSPNNPNPNI